MGGVITALFCVVAGLFPHLTEAYYLLIGSMIISLVMFLTWAGTRRNTEEEITGGYESIILFTSDEFWKHFKSGEVPVEKEKPYIGVLAVYVLAVVFSIFNLFPLALAALAYNTNRARLLSGWKQVRITRYVLMGIYAALVIGSAVATKNYWFLFLTPGAATFKED